MGPPDPTADHPRGWVITHTVCTVSCSLKCRGTRALAPHLPNGHGTEDVQEDEGAVGAVVPQQVPVRQALDVGERGERQLGHHSAVKSEKEKTRDCCIWKTDKLLSSREEPGTEIELSAP